MLLGWKYVRRGPCHLCGNDWDRLYIPVVEKGQARIVMFTPVCSGCSNSYDLKIPCKKCRAPLQRVRVGEEVRYDCTVCPPPSTGTLR